MTALWRQGLPVESLITHTFPLEQIAEGYLLMQGESGKVLVEYD
jgi:Zn-dependent alcohol dehydrogenase